MAAKALTVKAIEALKGSASRREIPDGGRPGLYLVVQPSGLKSWAVRYRAKGKPRKLTLGAYPALGLAAARDAAVQALREVSEGGDPAEAKKALKTAPKAAEGRGQATTVAEAFDQFLTRHVRAKRRPATVEAYEGAVRSKVLPAWGDRPIAEIDRKAVRDLLDGLVDRGTPYAANRLHALLRVAFGWFADRDIVQVSPVVQKAPAKEESRDRVLSDSEVRWLWQATDAVGWPFGPMVKLLVVTAQRREEVSGAEWVEFALAGDRPEWVIPKERAKNGASNAVPLSPLALSILQGLPRVKDGQGRERFILTTTGDSPISGFAKAKASLDAAMTALAQREAADRGEDAQLVSIAPWRFHDLRRTAASGMAALGVAPHIIERILNHRAGVIRGVAAVYNRHRYADECRQALVAWSERVKAGTASL